MVLAALGALGLQVSRGFALESGLLALLPGDQARPLLGKAVQTMADAGSKRVVILVGHADADAAGVAADAAAAGLSGKAGIAFAKAKVEGDFAAKARDYYLPQRYRLLTEAQRRRLQGTPEPVLVQEAVQAIYSPLGPPRLAPLESDPFNLFSEALLEAASRSAVRTSGERLVLEAQGKTWVLVLVELEHSAVSLGEQRELLAALEQGVSAAKAAGAQEVLRAGFVFHAAEAAAQAQREISTIGLGSLLGVLLLMFWVFRTLRPLALALLPIAVGCLTAVVAGQALFDRLHLLTLVFGTSIIGVAVDYGLLFMAGRAAPGPWRPLERRRAILPSLAMALGTSLLAYGALAAMPFPILRQMGVFTMLGLLGAWLTALLWLPLLADGLPPMSLPWLQRLQAWPRVDQSRRLRLALGAAIVLALLGLARLKSDDDVRQLYASAPDTVRQQEAVQTLMRLPSTGQFFLVSGADEEALLQAEEALASSLDDAGIAYQSVSQFVPSQRRQAENAALQARLYRPRGPVAQLFGALGSPETAALAQEQARDASKTPALLPGDWLASPLSAPFRALWLGRGPEGCSGIVSVSGLDAAGLKALPALAAEHPGVQFVDHPASLSALLKGFRGILSWLLLAGYAVVGGLLALRYRRDAWRVLLPTMLACLFTAGAFGWLGLNANLFFVFGILLSLDMGVDYAIYLQEQGNGGLNVSFLGASLAAITTLLSFGLLGLSRTPALQAFGLTVLLGISGSWLLAPCFAKGERP